MEKRPPSHTSVAEELIFFNQTKYKTVHLLLKYEMLNGYVAADFLP